MPIGTTDGNMTYAQMTQYADFLPQAALYPGGAMGGARSKLLLAAEVAPRSKEFYKRLRRRRRSSPTSPPSSAGMPGMIVVHALRTLGPEADGAAGP